MKEEYPSENRVKSASKFADQNQIPKDHNLKGNNSNGSSKQQRSSSWGSHIVKGFSAEKKTKPSQTSAVPSKKPPLLLSSNAANLKKNPFVPSHSRVKRSLIGDLSCSAGQVYPPGSRDLLLELDHLRRLLDESKEREVVLQSELSECKRAPRLLELERELEVKKSEVDSLVRRVGSLEAEKRSLSEQLAKLNTISEQEQVLKKEDHEFSNAALLPRNLEMEVVVLRRLNKELQLQKRNLSCRLSSMESQLATLARDSESEVVAKIKAEVTLLRHTNENLCKQVEGLQMSRLNEVEELAYLRWVNSCFKNELRNSCSARNSDKSSSPNSDERSSQFSSLLSCSVDESIEYSSTKKLNLIKKLRKCSIIDENLLNLNCPDDPLDKSWVDSVEGVDPRRRHSISGLKCSAEDFVPSKRRQSDGFMCSKEMENEAELLVSQQYDLAIIPRPEFYGNIQESNKSTAPFNVDKRALRIPNPPPRPSCTNSGGPKEEGSGKISVAPPPPPPPPPPKFSARSTAGMVQRAPQVVEFYHTLMKRDSRKDPSNGGICDAPDVANVRSCMIDEIENRSSHLIAIKEDVETQGDFVRSLIREVNSAVYKNMGDVVEFVKWLDDELGFLVDERAVLKHFEWPEKKADTLREAAFGYRDLMKLDSEVSHYKDDSHIPCDIALKKMVTLSEKMERTVYNLLRTRESLMRHCKEFQIPTDWMLDNGIISKIKFGSVKLAKQYMKRVALELQSKWALEKDPAMDYMLLQGVRFAFRIHQFAGGFDAETMQAFEELRNIAHFLNKK